MSNSDSNHGVVPVILQELTPLNNLPDGINPVDLQEYLYRRLGITPKKAKSKGYSYVGLIEYPTPVQNYMLYFFPKYYDVSAIKPEDMFIAPDDSSGKRTKYYKHFSLVLKTINKYRWENYQTAVRENQMLSQTDWNDSDQNSKLAIAVTLIMDYLENGVYSNMKIRHTLCGNGEIDWNRTINHVAPVINDDGPYYFDYWTTDRVPNTETVIARVHEAIIKDCSVELSQYGLSELLELETPAPYEGELDDFGDAEHIAMLIQRELAVQFVTQKQNLLNLMLAYIRKESAAAEEGISMFGTASFHTVWEKVCGRVFGNKLDDPIDRKFLPEEYKNASKWSDIEARSIWLVGGSRTESVEEEAADETEENSSDKYTASKLKPDFVALKEEDGKRGILYILDAKYYVPKFSSKSVDDCPGVGDVNKQHLYQLTYLPLIGKNNWLVVNAFLMPSSYKNFQKTKKEISTYCSLFDKLKVVSDNGCFTFAKIQTSFLDPEQLFRDYLNGDQQYLNNPLIKNLKA